MRKHLYIYMYILQNIYVHRSDNLVAQVVHEREAYRDTRSHKQNSRLSFRENGENTQFQGIRRHLIPVRLMSRNVHRMQKCPEPAHCFYPQLPNSQWQRSVASTTTCHDGRKGRSCDPCLELRTQSDRGGSSTDHRARSTNKLTGTRDSPVALESTITK